jgi:hypothetical protein
MKQISWRHHYIPEFYLKGFTNENNQFSIYSTKDKKFKKDGKLFSPESHFFKKHDNTIDDLKKSPIDLLENHYSELESKFAPIFNKLKNEEGENCYGITLEERIMLQYYVSILFWRLPSNNEIVKEMTTHDIFEFLGLKVTDEDALENIKRLQFAEKIKQHRDYHKILRLWIPQMTFPTMFDNNSTTTITTFPSNKLPAICSDNPLILRHPEKLDLYNDDFVLPLNRNVILLRTRKNRQPIHTTIKIHIDMMVLIQSKELVSCTDTKYVDMLKDIFQKDFITLDNLRKYIFNHLCEN